MEPKFIVMTPVYITEGNGRLDKFIDCIDSVQKQSYPNFVHLIIDDGSTLPELGTILESFKKKHVNKFKFIRTKNQGVVKALISLFEEGVNIAGDVDYLLRLNSDDLLPESAISSYYKLIRNNPKIDVLCGSALIFHNNWDRLELISSPSFKSNTEMWRYLVEHKPFPHLNFCWKKEFFKKYASRLDPDIPYSEDWDQAIITAKGLLDSGGTYKATDAITYLFRKEDTSLGWLQAMDLKGKILSYNSILKKQVSGLDFAWQSFLNVIRILRIRIGLLFPIRLRDKIMPPFAKIVSPDQIDSDILELIKRARKFS